MRISSQIRVTNTRFAYRLAALISTHKQKSMRETLLNMQVWFFHLWTRGKRNVRYWKLPYHTFSLQPNLTITQTHDIVLFIINTCEVLCYVMLPMRVREFVQNRALSDKNREIWFLGLGDLHYIPETEFNSWVDWQLVALWLSRQILRNLINTSLNWACCLVFACLPRFMQIFRGNKILSGGKVSQVYRPCPLLGTSVYAAF